MALTTAPVELITLDDGVTITVDDNSTALNIISTDADASVGPILDLYRNSSSPADDDYLARFRFIGRNDNSQDFTAVDFLGRSIDVSDGTEDATLFINVMTGGGAYNRLNITPTELNLNDESRNVDFRVESDGNANAFFVDAGNDVVNVGGSTVETGDQFSIHGSGTNTTMRIYNTNAGSDGGLLIFQKDSSSPADGDILGDIRFHGDDSAGGMTQYGRIRCFSTDVTNGTEDGQINLEATLNGTSRQRLKLDDTQAVFNEEGQDLDFRVESNADTHALFVDASAEVVNFFTNTGVSTSGTSTVGCSIFTSGQLALQSDDSLGSGGTLILGRINADDGDQLVVFGTNGTMDRGSINMRGNEFIAVGSGDTFLEFNFGSDQVNPSSGSASRDAAISLGSSNARFTSLYLSDGLYVGGTGSANKLDDYEEGTHTTAFTASTSGSITLSTNTMAYTKVGRLVTCTGYFAVSSVSSPVGLLNISLPFTLASGTQFSASASVSFNSLASGEIYEAWPLAVNNTNSLRVYIGTGTSVSASFAQLVGAGTDVRISFTFMTT